MSDTTFSSDATQESFQRLVIDASAAVPVLVDFWAEWCAPCRSLMPVLAKLAQEYAGKLLLVKVNSDQQQALAQQYNVRSLPTVKVFRHGQVVEEFMGAQPEHLIREIIERHIVRESDALREQARDALASGDHQRALQLLEQAVAADPDIADNRIELANALASAREFDKAEQILDDLNRSLQDDESVRRLRARIHYAGVAMREPAIEILEQRVERDGTDLTARLGLAAHYLTLARYREALDQLLEIMRRDRKFGDDAGYQGLLAAFLMVGGDDPLVSEYRKKMAALLY